MAALLGFVFLLGGCARTMMLHPDARYVALHCTKGKGELPNESVTLAADYERGLSEVLYINNQKVASFDACKAVVVDAAAVCAYDVVPKCGEGDCSVAIHTCR